MDLRERIISADASKKFWVIAGLLVLIHVLVTIALVLFFPSSEDHIILRYNVYFGIDLLGAWWQVFLLPGLSFLFLAANLLLARRFLKRGEWLLSILLLFGSGILSFALAVAVGALVLVNY